MKNQTDQPFRFPVGKVQLLADLGGVSENASPLAYVIRRTDGAGLMATLGTVLTQMAVAEWLGAEPVVDLSKGSSYAESEEILGTNNVWEYYFSPVGKTFEALESGGYHLIYSEEHHPIVRWENVETAYRFLWEKYVAINPQTLAFIEEGLSSLNLGPKTIGVHVRGGDMRLAPSHPLPPSLPQLETAIRRLLDTGEYDHIFVAAQEETHVAQLRQSFGDRLSANRNFRLTDRVSRLGTPFSGGTSKNVRKFASEIRHHHRFELGREALLDVISLSKTGALVSGHSNVAMWSNILRETRLRQHVLIENGWNSKSGLLAPATWKIRSMVPVGLGGFRNWSEGWIRE